MLPLDGVSVPIAGARELFESSQLLVGAQPAAQGFEFTLAGRQGGRFAIEISTDLVQWELWTEVTNRTGRLALVISADRPCRFVRARLIE